MYFPSIQTLIHNKKNYAKILKLLRMIKIHCRHYRIIRNEKVNSRINNNKKLNERNNRNLEFKMIVKIYRVYLIILK